MRVIDETEFETLRNKGKLNLGAAVAPPPPPEPPPVDKSADALKEAVGKLVNAIENAADKQVKAAEKPEPKQMVMPAPVVNVNIPERPSTYTLEVVSRNKAGQIEQVRITAGREKT